MGSFFDFLVEKLASFLQIILDFLKECMQWAIDAIIYIFTDFCHDILDYAVSQLQGVFSNIPFDIPTVPSDIWSYADYFFPCSECVVGLTWLFSLWLGVLVLKIILKAIPTVY